MDGANENAALINAARAGNLIEVERILALAGANPGWNNCGALRAAAAHGHKDLLVLIASDPRVDLFQALAALRRAGWWQLDAAAFLERRRQVDPIAATLWDVANYSRAERLREACVQGDLQLLDRIMHDPSFDAPPVLPQGLMHGKVQEGEEEVVAARLAAEWRELVHQRALAAAIQGQQAAVVQRLLADGHFDPTANRCESVVTAYVSGNASILDMLLADPRVHERMREPWARIAVACIAEPAARFEAARRLQIDERVIPPASLVGGSLAWLITVLLGHGAVTAVPTLLPLHRLLPEANARSTAAALGPLRLRRIAGERGIAWHKLTDVQAWAWLHNEPRRLRRHDGVLFVGNAGGRHGSALRQLAERMLGHPLPAADAGHLLVKPDASPWAIVREMSRARTPQWLQSLSAAVAAVGPAGSALPWHLPFAFTMASLLALSRRQAEVADTPAQLDVHSPGAAALAAAGNLAAVPALHSELLAAAQGYRLARQSGFSWPASCFTFSRVPLFLGLAAAPLVAYSTAKGLHGRLQLQWSSTDALLPTASRKPDAPAASLEQSRAPSRTLWQRFGSSIAGALACFSVGLALDAATAVRVAVPAVEEPVDVSRLTPVEASLARHAAQRGIGVHLVEAPLAHAQQLPPSESWAAWRRTFQSVAKMGSVYLSPAQGKAHAAALPEDMSSLRSKSAAASKASFPSRGGDVLLWQPGASTSGNAEFSFTRSEVAFRGLRSSGVFLARGLAFAEAAGVRSSAWPAPLRTLAYHALQPRVAALIAAGTVVSTDERQGFRFAAAATVVGLGHLMHSNFASGCVHGYRLLRQAGTNRGAALSICSGLPSMVSMALAPLAAHYAKKYCGGYDS